MGKVHAAIEGRLREFVEAQPVFFVATAALAGTVNVSPKGLADSFAVIDEHTVAYLDLTASGAETIAHVRENGRITVMFCSFDRTPNVVRLHGTGRVVSVHDDGFERWAALFPANPSARAVIVVDVERVSDSCGFALPVLRLESERDLLTPNMARRGPEGVVAYRRTKNRVSIDGLPAFEDDEPSRPSPPVGGPVPGWTAREPLVPITLRGRYVDVVPLEVGQADALYDATCTDPARWTYLGDEMPETREDFTTYLSGRVARRDEAGLAIVPKHGAPCGMASWMRCDQANGVVEVGSILFGERLARTAAATEAMWLMARHAFEAGYRRYEWKCDALNAPSRVAAARLGFRYEGTFRQAVVVKGRTRDTAWFAMTDREWRALAPAYEQWLDGSTFTDPAAGTGQRRSLSTLTRAALRGVPR